MTDRKSRYIAFEQFHQASKGLFEGYANATKDKRLAELYSFYVRPGGRYGGSDKKIVEIFYGSFPFGVYIKNANNINPTRTLEKAHGATLQYQRTDDGQVLCTLVPASSENFHYSEDFIILDIIRNPDELIKKSKCHWVLFQAYMESTCLDGKPNYYQKILTTYLRTCKEYVVNNTLQKRKSTRLVYDITKYALTIGLSGFVILLITWVKESESDDQLVQKQQQELKIYNDISNNVRAISDMSIKINENLEGYNGEIAGDLKLINSNILENTVAFKEAISTLKGVVKNENGKDKKNNN